MKRKVRGRKIGDFFFAYSWRDLGAVRELRNTWVSIYIGTGIFGAVFAPLGSSYESAIILGALACYPAYLLGLRSQRTNNPLALEREELMVWRMSFIARVFTAVGVVFLARHMLHS